MDRQQLIRDLRQLHAEKLGIIFQYLNHHYLGVGADSNGYEENSSFTFIADESSNQVVNRFREAALEAMVQADRIAQRIDDLGGEPQNDIAPIMTAEILPEMVHYNLARELELLERCQTISAKAELAGDPQTQELVEEIALTKEQRAEWLESTLTTTQLG